MDVDCDLFIVGAGPAGLFAAYYAGFRGLSVCVADSLPELGGQITALYPEKPIHDVAGFPSVTGRELIDRLVEQAASADPTYLTDCSVTDLRADDEGVVATCADGTRITAGAALLTAGIGSFSPRELPAGQEWLGRGLEHFVPDREPYRDRDVVIVGGGDSAFDWAQHLEPVARSVTLVHRRDRFRAHAATVEAVRASPVRLVTGAQVEAIEGGDGIEAVLVRTEDGVQRLPAQRVVAALGFLADLAALKGWGLELDGNHVGVDTAMRTNLPRVFAAGDLTVYPGKVRLVAVGFGEAATAVNNAAVAIDPAAHVFPGHSSEE